jgi:hypothetical protein
VCTQKDRYLVDEIVLVDKSFAIASVAVPIFYAYITLQSPAGTVETKKLDNCNKGGTSGGGGVMQWTTLNCKK